MLSTIADYTRLTKDMGKSLTQVALAEHSGQHEPEWD